MTPEVALAIGLVGATLVWLPMLLFVNRRLDRREQQVRELKASNRLLVDILDEEVGGSRASSLPSDPAEVRRAIDELVGVPEFWEDLDGYQGE